MNLDVLRFVLQMTRGILCRPLPPKALGGVGALGLPCTEPLKETAFFTSAGRHFPSTLTATPFKSVAWQTISCFIHSFREKIRPRHQYTPDDDYGFIS